jgi:hypothetical protein
MELPVCVRSIWVLLRNSSFFFAPYTFRRNFIYLWISLQFHLSTGVNIPGNDPSLVLFSRMQSIINSLLPCTHILIDIDLVSSSTFIFSAACVTLCAVYTAAVCHLLLLHKETRCDRHASIPYFKSTAEACGPVFCLKNDVLRDRYMPM